MITVNDIGIGELIEKKSKFIGYAKHVSSVAEAEEFIAEIKSKHWDAKHNVYAYVIGENGNLQRSTDDGEPSGTAGRPVLEIIKGEGLTDTVIVVTRYFGGILLGTGGLVRAYGKAAKLALENCTKVKPLLMKTVALSCDYDLVGKAENFLLRKETVIDRIEYQNSAVIYCLLPENETDGFLEIILQQFQDEIQCIVLNEEHIRYVPI